ncbi:MED7-domain-containing protein [Hyaloscypha bicolor E]|uniref:Mediator of RNA polymerase II transcription subunit 7 n=1 Tax=Hyaloscypha bicolor E TaxID=1095630 RepID=A0A2J6TRU1_9HELO|nr:MED7-domain-containing protein [Hyaloscypha bicolor E]PMD65740.1 MED7-domain-containing protein [Hyaloscypha bicolor E]
MEEQQQQNVLAAAFPTPPPFWQSFTPENLSSISSLRAAEPQSSSSKVEPDPATELPIRLLDLPAELRCLQPPEPPVEGLYRCFGDLYNMNDPLPSLEEQGIEQLYTPPLTPTSNNGGKHTDRALILKRIAKSLLLNFLELVGIMSVNPEQYQEKIQDLRTLFINFHHLLNEYRPHQARESLIQMMQTQLERSRAETQGIREMKMKVEGILEGLSHAKLAEEKENEESGNEVVEDRRDVWEALEREFG